MSATQTWFDSSAKSYTTESTTVDDLLVTVCLDDEGPLRPAFYWLIEHEGRLLTDGWAGSVKQARIDALAEAAL